jgi:superfamily II DNA/RNA helicase
VLLATNIVARGIDIRDVCFVINVDAPREGRRDNSVISIDTYLHRVGRTGRHSDKGVALTLIDDKDHNYLIESVKKIHKVDIRKL